jgi:hypothetical protein
MKIPWTVVLITKEEITNQRQIRNRMIGGLLELVELPKSIVLSWQSSATMHCNPNTPGKKKALLYGLD